jgi:hypothetical protein
VFWKRLADSNAFLPPPSSFYLLVTLVNRFNSSLASPDTETAANTLVLVGHGIHNHLARLEEMKIRKHNRFG